tara:strand:- start:469 stop:1260 length:792 start_codon:yes stop_codon:yes gene_type:complete
MINKFETHRYKLEYIEANPYESDHVLFFIHGFLGTKETWDKVTRLLGINHHYITIDLPGCGNSTNISDYSYTCSEIAETLYELVEHLNLKSIILVGHGSGAVVASMLYEHISSYVIGMTLLCPGFHMQPVNKFQHIPRCMVDYFAGKMCEYTKRYTLLKQAHQEANNASYYIDHFSKSCRPDVVSKFLKGKDPPYVKFINIINRPVMVILGKNDSISPPDAVIELTKSNHNFEYRQIETSSHYLQHEFPQVVVNLLKELIIKC